MTSSHGDGPETGLGQLGQHEDACDSGGEGEHGGYPERGDVALPEELVPWTGADGDDHLRHHDGDVEDPRAQPCTTCTDTSSAQGPDQPWKFLGARQQRSSASKRLTLPATFARRQLRRHGERNAAQDLHAYDEAPAGESVSFSIET